MQVVTPTRESLTSQVYRALLEAIVVGELGPGTLHSVGRLAERLGVSRSPAREALITLAEQGMVVFERNRGVRIQETTAHDLEEVFSMRLLLEVPASFRAARLAQPHDVERIAEALGTLEAFVSAPTVRAHQEIDFAFHRAVLETAGNKRLTAVAENLWAHQRLRGVSTAGRDRTLADIFADHQRVHEAIAAGDAEAAAAAMHRHLVTTGGLLLAREAGRSSGDTSLELPWLQVYADLGGPTAP